MTKNPAFEGIFRNIISFIGRSAPNRAWDWQAALLTIALVQISSTRLAISEWVPSLYVTERISLCAVILGLALGYSSFTRKNAIWAVIEYGLLLIPMQLLTAIDRTENSYDDLRNLFTRLFDSISLFLHNQPVYDAIFFLLLTSIGFWIVGTYVGYRLTRHRDFLDAALAPGLIVLLVQIYDPWMPVRAWGLAVYIFVALALLGRLQYLENRINWRRKHVFLSSDTEWEISRSLLSAAAITVVIAWALPGALSSVKPAAKAWQNLTDPILNRLSDAVSALDSPYGTSSGRDFYGTDLKLGTYAPVSDTPVFYVQVEETDIHVPRYYWRGRVYDQYENGQWTDTNTLRQSFNPEKDEVRLAESSQRTKVDITVTMNFPKQELLYAPSEMVWVDQEGRMIVNPLPGNAREVTAWFAEPSLAAGESYEVRALIANPTIQNLRATGTEYPHWVVESYLQVPEKIEPRFRQLAERITAPYNNPYDKAQAVTSFLRREIQYEAKINETPPKGQDPLLWVLFDHKKGFCMYYASAEVILLRTVGIPARMAVGFAQGEYDRERGRYTVARFNSHAWPEVYFPGIGWVEFEPTSNQNPLDRPRDEIEDDSGNPAGGTAQEDPLVNLNEGLQDPSDVERRLNEDQNLPAAGSTNPWARLLAPALSLVLTVGAGFVVKYYSLTERLPVYLVDRYIKSGSHPPRWLSNWAIWSRLLPIERSFHTINLSLRLLGQTPPAFATPAERARLLAKSLPSAGDAIKVLAGEHQTALFTSRRPNLAQARRASLKIIFETWRTRIFRYRQYLKQRYN